MRCIFCLAGNADLVFSNEHVFPEAIGGRFTIGNVCKPCNDRLGSKVDCPLTEHFAIQCKRQELDLPGKTGKVPNVWERMELAEKPGRQIINRLDAQGKPQHYLVPHMERIKDEEGNPKSVSFEIDASDLHLLPEMVNKALLRAGRPTMSVDEVMSSAQVRRMDQPGMQKLITVNDHDYKRGVLKIVYEMACHWLGDAYLDDPVAGTLRQCILSDEPPDEETTRVFFNTIDYHEDGGTGRFWDQEENSHLCIFTPMWPAGIAAYVRVFKIFLGTVLVSQFKAAERYPSFEGMFLANPIGAGEIREVPLRTEIRRNRLNPQP